MSNSVTFSLLSVSGAFWLHVVESLVQVTVDIERRAA
jgi:hypothetical protein